MNYEVSYVSGIEQKLSFQKRDTLQEAVAYALILEARKELNCKVVKIKDLNYDK
jgi:hypothetical protein